MIIGTSLLKNVLDGEVLLARWVEGISKIMNINDNKHWWLNKKWGLKGYEIVRLLIYIIII